MFLFDYFYGTKAKKPSGQGQEDEWVLVDNNLPSTSTTSNNLAISKTSTEDDHVFVEKGETIMDQFKPELEPKVAEAPRAITPTPADELEAKGEELEGAVGGETELEVQNPNGGGRIKPRVAQPPILNSTTLNNLVKAETKKPNKNILDCKKHSQRQQRRADKYKNGVWSGKSNDRKCGKCY